MGRKILQNLTKAHSAMSHSPALVPASLRTTASAPSIGGLREGLDKLASSAIRDIEPRFIESDGLQDRLQFSEGDVADLAESIRAHGQQVPILVRPSERPGYFRVVYGRRRLAAIRLVGGPVKAIVRTLDDRSAVLAQGQENNLRLDPSFIEKAVFVKAMREAGYNTETIMAALGVSKQSVSTYEVVLPFIPMELILAIGPAHAIGRRKWQELAEIARSGVDLIEVLNQSIENLDKFSASGDRFEYFLVAANAAAGGTPPGAAEQESETPVYRGGQGPIRIDGRRIGYIKTSARSVGIEIARSEAPEFGQWIMENADEAVRILLDRWKKSEGRG
ncbi:plasmid partitioning protein RepB [Paracoccus benzoatiresistens]|uniref:Plasmid partitioning protein RepB n=1 Tax=Paracoccus benzoatiresistens TaxID=2997341 RepID=A0ABT4JAJ0_9RHOB|nr:plasmid partitioning protein RepB [Paracoccus sp. EF6]MCZ0964094.1 plasmid partitioning protein RepB [Paracoccus sp. EF6]